MARYRHAHRSALLNLTVVGLAAATATLWIARPVLPSPEAIALRLRPVSQPPHRASAPPPASAGAPNSSIALIGAPATQTAAATDTATPAATPTATPEATETASPTETPTATAQDGAPATPAADSESAADPPAAAGAEAAPDQPAAAEAAIVAVPPAPPPPPARRYVRAQAAQTAYLRTDPTVAALIIGSLPPGSVVGVVGCANGCNWLLVTLPGGGEAWSESYFYYVLGSLAGL